MSEESEVLDNDLREWNKEKKQEQNERYGEEAE